MIICLFKKSCLELINVDILEQNAYVVMFHGLDTIKGLLFYLNPVAKWI